MAKKDWLPTSAAAKELGFSQKHLSRLRGEGLLKAGKHWRDIRRPNAARATYHWHVKRIAEVLGIAPERRL